MNVVFQEYPEFKAEMSNTLNFDVTLSDDFNFSASFIDTLGFSVTLQDDSDFDVSFDSGFAKETYSGPYTITPLTTGPVLVLTDDKLMSDDITVLKVPQYETSNPSGGLTLTM